MKVFTLLILALFHCSIISSQSEFQLDYELWSKNDSKPNIDSLTIDVLNFNRAIDLDSFTPNYENVLDEYYTLIFVYQAPETYDGELVKLSTSKEEKLITNRYIKQDEEILFDKSYSETGRIVSYYGNFQDFSKTNSLSFEEFIQNRKKDAPYNLMEVFYFPRILRLLERHKLESYLSIKYGISLIGKKDYINSVNDTIWKYEDNQHYAKRVTGVGRDDNYGLDQLSSGNSTDNELFTVIVANDGQDSLQISDRNFVVWGDNDETLLWEPKSLNDIEFKKIRREWRSVSTMDFPKNITIKLNKSSILKENGQFEKVQSSESEMTFYLSKASSEEHMDAPFSELIRPSKQDDTFVYFENIDLSSNDTNLITFLYGPELLFTVKGTSDCSTTRLNAQLSITGGEAPYSAIVLNQDGSREYNSEEKNMEIIVSPGENRIEIFDSNNVSYSDMIFIDAQEKVSVDLRKNWILNRDGSTTVIPNIQNNNLDTEIRFEWLFKNKVISTNATLAVHEEGAYVLRLHINETCIVEKKFNVISDSGMQSNASLFPNPVQPNTNFNFQYTLFKNQDVGIKIHNLSGQLLRSERLENTSQVNYVDRLSSSGVYFLVVETQESTATFKIIVE